MKKLLLVATLLVSVSVLGQKKHAGVTHGNVSRVTADSISVDTTKTKWSKYIAVGLSISNGNDYGDNSNTYSFQESVYPSLEFGFTRENLSLSGVIGRGNLKGIGQSKYNLDDSSGELKYDSDNGCKYYWEIKATPTFPLGVVTASIIFGAGSYFSTEKGSTFIEYGSGISYSVGNITYGVCYTNWDGVDYITPNISYTFN